MSTSPFALVLCQAGAERWLKAELARIRPDLRPAFQRPGLVTFKATKNAFGANEAPDSIFGRAFAASAGSVPDVAGVLEIAAQQKATRLFVGPRDQGLPGEVSPIRQEQADAHAAEIQAALHASGLFLGGTPAKGDVVLDVVTSPDEPIVVGWHIHGPGRHTGPGGTYSYTVPEDLPSRGWFKMTEGLLWSGAQIKPGDIVLEIGAAPGGATRALIDLGARVVAVDPQPMDPELLKSQQVRWIRRAIGDVRFEELPEAVRWIAADAAIPPPHVIGALRRLCKHYHGSLAGMLLTFKINNDDSVASLPDVLAELRSLGFREVRARHLPANRNDVFVTAR